MVFTLGLRPCLSKRPASLRSELLVEKEGSIVSAKSIMGLLTIEGSKGAVLKITAKGADAEEALDALESLVKQKFFED